jgi:hypothetical protein
VENSSQKGVDAHNMKPVKNRDTIVSGDKVILWGLIREGESRYILDENARLLKGAMEDRGAEVVAIIIDDAESANDMMPQRLTSQIHEHNAHVLLFGVEEGVLFFPHGECRHGYL